MNVDLHIHSTASDGSMTPGEIVALALSLELKAIAITDHDTVDGAKDVLQHGCPVELSFIPGVEISSTPPSPFVSSGSFHILGYGIRPDDPDLDCALKKVQQARTERNPKIISRLNDEGMMISLDEVIEQAGGDVIGRPHMAQVLVKKGYVSSIKEAFDRFLAKGKPAYVEKYKLTCDEAIQVIRKAGGIPVLAHPVSLGMDTETLSRLLDRLCSMGLLGLEAYYSTHSPQETETFCRLAEDKNLVITGGSDFHGSFKADIALGCGRGDLHVPFSVYENVAGKIRELEKDLREGTVPDDIQAFEKKIHYAFKNRSVLEQALRHSSYVNEQVDSSLEDNERLEFLGDAVLNLVIGHILMKKYPALHEGDLSRMRSNLVNETHLAQIARDIGMGPEIKLGKGEDLTNGREKNSILSDGLEALIAAVYVDGGFDVVFSFVEQKFRDYIENSKSPAMNHDSKSKLQEFSQFHLKAMPRYRVVHESGPDHDKTFKVLLTINDLETYGTGKSKKSAEQDAAANALDSLQKIYSQPDRL